LRKKYSLTSGLYVMVLIWTLFLASFFSQSKVAFAYNCTSPHCYGVTIWNGNVDGSATYLMVRHIYDNNGYGFINNEMWLADGNGSKWIEAGYKANAGSVQFFWSEQPPGGTFVRHLLGNVPSSQFDRNVSVELHAYSTYMTASIYSSYVNYNDTTCENPNIGCWRGDMNMIEIGEELNGTSTGSAPQASWSLNQYVQGNGYYYQTRQGDYVSITNPPGAGWNVYPAPGGSGGVWLASCC